MDKNIKSLWVSVKTTADTKPGIYPITITLKNDKEQISEKVTMNLEIIDAAFVAAGWAQHGKALLYRFHPDKDRNDQSFGMFKSNHQLPSFSFFLMVSVNKNGGH